jgi:excisionase family DNA binding protein
MKSPPGPGSTSDPNSDTFRRRPPRGAAGGAVGPQGGTARELGIEKKHPKDTNISNAITDHGLLALLDSSQIAGMLGITERHVRRLVLERRIPFAKVGRFVRFDPRDIEQWVQAAKVPTVTPRRHHGATSTLGDRT